MLTENLGKGDIGAGGFLLPKIPFVFNALSRLADPVIEPMAAT
jgi:hypothetical protein